MAVLSIPLFFCFANSFAIKEYSLDQLCKDPNFEISISSNGSFSGNSVLLKVKSNHKKNVELFIPGGTLFYTPDQSEQRLMLVEDHRLLITKGKLKKKILDAYCTEMSDRIPSANSGMEFRLSEDENLSKLARFINKNEGFSDHTIQEAVWCLTDSQSLANIYSKDAEKAFQLSQFVAELTGQEVTWHRVKRNHATVGGFVMVNPVQVSGELTWTTEKAITLKSKVVDSSGDLVYEYPESMEVPKSNKVSLSFDLSVSGWEAGRYSVVYYDQDGNLILKKAFEI